MSDLHPSREIVVVGAGPAGLQAALAAHDAGARVTLVDASPEAGGQIWRGGHPPSRIAARLLGRLRDSPVQFLRGCTIVDAPKPGQLLAMHDGNPLWLSYHRLVLATGARERFLPFPGWTLPNVLGVGGIQALAKGGLDLAGKRVVVAGSGPLLLSVAASLPLYGAQVPVIAEQASLSHLVRFALGLRYLPGKIPEALQLAWRLQPLRFQAATYPVRAHGDMRLTAVTLRSADREWTVDCDYLACAFGFVPNLELAELLGCTVREGFVVVDNWQQTTAPDVYCAGEPTGIGGAEKAMAEGAVAGLAAALLPEDANSPVSRNLHSQAAPHLARRARCHHFAQVLERSFPLRPELRDLPLPETTVCRCEDVPLIHLEGCSSWRDAKLQRRLGMGHCQGRVCGAATEFLLGWPMQSVRPPLSPVPVRLLAAAALAKADDSNPHPQTRPGQ